MDSEIMHIEELLAVLVREARLGIFGDANRDLNACLLSIQRLQAAGAMQSVPGNIMKKFDYSLETIFLMLGNKDWVAIADIIEFEMLALWHEAASHCVACA